MRIGLSCLVLGRDHDGIATYLCGLIRALGNLALDEFVAFVPERYEERVPPAPPNFSYRVVPQRWCRPVPNVLWHNLRLPSIARRESLDLLHVPSYRRAPLRASCPVVVTVHDLAPWSLPGKYDWRRELYARWLVPRALRRCRHVIACSRATAADLDRHLGIGDERVSVVYSGVDHETWHPLPEDQSRALLSETLGLEGRFLLNVSRIEHPGKNHVRLIEAYERLRDGGVPHKLVLAGPLSTGSDRVARRIEASPYADGILLTGKVSTSQLVALYSSCDLAIHPSLVEGFGFPVVEAAACGSPSICADTSALRELAAGRFPTFDPWSPDDIAATAQRALAVPRDTEALRRFARNFRWEDTARRVSKVYRAAWPAESSGTAVRRLSGASYQTPRRPTLSPTEVRRRLRGHVRN